MRRTRTPFAGEIYWVEITDRNDIGMDLNAPQRRDDGGEFWGYSLILEPRDGDVDTEGGRTFLVGLRDLTESILVPRDPVERAVLSGPHVRCRPRLGKRDRAGSGR